MSRNHESVRKIDRLSRGLSGGGRRYRGGAHRYREYPDPAGSDTVRHSFPDLDDTVTYGPPTLPIRPVPERDGMPLHTWLTYALSTVCIGLLALYAVLLEAQNSPPVTHVPPVFSSAPAVVGTVVLPIPSVAASAPAKATHKATSPRTTAPVHRTATPSRTPSSVPAVPVPTPSVTKTPGPDPTDSSS